MPSSQSSLIKQQCVEIQLTDHRLNDIKISVFHTHTHTHSLLGINLHAGVCLV